MYQMRRGLGATSDRTVTLSNGRTITVDAAGNWVRPACGYLPFIRLAFQDCSDPTAAELSEANALALFGPAASPETIAAAERAWAQTDVQQCAQFPEACAIANAPSPAVASVAATVGDVVEPIGNLASGLLHTASDITGTLKCGLFKTEQSDGTCATNWTPVLVLGAAGLAVLFVTMQSTGRRRRR